MNSTARTFLYLAAKQSCSLTGEQIETLIAHLNRGVRVIKYGLGGDGYQADRDIYVVTASNRALWIKPDGSEHDCF